MRQSKNARSKLEIIIATIRLACSIGFESVLRAELVQFWNRVDRAQYALACDDEACEHYKETPCRWFRTKLAAKAFLLNK